MINPQTIRQYVCECWLDELTPDDAKQEIDAAVAIAKRKHPEISENQLRIVMTSDDDSMSCDLYIVRNETAVEANARAVKEQASELAQLARLKAKYEGVANQSG